MKTIIRYGQLQTSLCHTSPWRTTATERFFNTLLSWGHTALLVGSIWSICYLLYLLLEKELA